jgi:mannosidase alpha-like ER degradation enhancer 1
LLVELETDTNCFCLFSLVIMGNNTEFEKGVRWLSENLTFDVDARINLFEVNN